LFNKQVSIKRVKPNQVVKEGDFSFTDKICRVRIKFLTKTFNLAQVNTIKTYFAQNHSNNSKGENTVAIVFEDGTTALFDVSNKSHQEVINDILLALGQNNVKWTTLLHAESNKPVLYQAPLLLT
jgi:hypothetical protein